MSMPETSPPRVRSESGAAPGAFQREEHELSFLDLVNVVLRHRGLVLGLPILLAALVVLATMLSARTYTASASFMPEASDKGGSRLAGIAAQFGVVVPAADQGQSPEFYAYLLTSREVLRALAETTYAFQVGDRAYRGTLVELIQQRGKTPDQRLESTLDKLRKRVSVKTDPETGVVHLSVRVRWAPLAEQLTHRLLDLVSTFNLERRQSQAAAERRFVEGRLGEAREELRSEQRRLQAFLERNRQFNNSPLLSFERDRLAQEVASRQGVYNSLSQAFENARIDEVRNTPVITVVDEPRRPVLPDPRATVLKALLAVVVGFLAAFAVAFSRELIRKSREDDPEQFDRYLALRTEALQDLRRPWRGLRWRRSRDRAQPHRE